MFLKSRDVVLVDVSLQCCVDIRDSAPGVTDWGGDSPLKKEDQRVCYSYMGLHASVSLGKSMPRGRVRSLIVTQIQE